MRSKSLLGVFLVVLIFPAIVFGEQQIPSPNPPQQTGFPDPQPKSRYGRTQRF
jgi:hypothetical protein